MHIKNIIWQNRRDFKAVYQCEYCNAEQTQGGYDDDNFHENVIPKMECEKCGKTADENYRPLATKYPVDVVV